MGRSVSTPSNCNEIAYRDVTWMGYEFDEETQEYDYSDCDQDMAQWQWGDFVDMIREDAKAQWTSFDDCDKWLGREDRVLLENTFAYIGVSEYCGLAAIWLKSKHDELDGSWYADEQRIANMADAWCNKICAKFNEMFGEYKLVGRFSNGEAVYEKA